MGFDLYGRKPGGEDRPDDPNWDDKEQVDAYLAWQDNTDGAYFRNSVWSWHPLFDFVYKHCKDIFEKAIEDELIDFKDIDSFYTSCHHNDGVMIPEELANKISERLDYIDTKGKLEQWEVEEDIIRERRPKEECDICNGTGTRKGWEGWHNKDTWIKLHGGLKVGPVSFKWASEMRGCNGCQGSGKKESFKNNYKFTAENAREFSRFAKLSGGFKIW